MIQVTDKAFLRIQQLIDLENINCKALRVAVDSGGCSGLMYKYEFTDTIEDDDDIIINENGVCVVVDKISQDFLVDSIVDYVEELGSSYFEIRNPKAKAKCGCGNSFAT